MKSKDFKDLYVWQSSMSLVKNIYSITDRFPQSERFCLIDQIRRAAVSIPSNIAEGQARSSKKDFIRFLYISQGSAAEVETQIILSEMLGYLPKNELESLVSQITEIKKMLSSLIAYLAKPKVID